MDPQLRSYIDKQRIVFKLRIALKNRELKKAEHERAGPEIIRELRTVMIKLADDFKDWKQNIKKRFEGMSEAQVFWFLANTRSCTI